MICIKRSRNGRGRPPYDGISAKGDDWKERGKRMSGTLFPLKSPSVRTSQAHPQQQTNKQLFGTQMTAIKLEWDSHSRGIYFI